MCPTSLLAPTNFLANRQLVIRTARSRLTRSYCNLWFSADSMFGTQYVTPIIKMAYFVTLSDTGQYQVRFIQMSPNRRIITLDSFDTFDEAMAAIEVHYGR